MIRRPVEMSYQELNELLDRYLLEENLPATINYHADSINYNKKQRLRILLKALHRLLKAQQHYMKDMRKQLEELKKTGQIYKELKETGCLRQQRIYFYLAKIGLTDLIKHLGGAFDDDLFSKFTIATMLYDAAFDLHICRPYLKTFDHFIMEGEYITSNDPYLSVFQKNVDYINEKIGENNFKKFMKYVRIEHISQLMSIYQLSDKTITKENLLKITFTKGGISGLALVYLMTPDISHDEKQAVYELGAVMQLIDDIVDMNEDIKSGISTLPNQKLLDYENLKSLYHGTINNLIEKCHLNPDKPNTTLDMLCWFDDIILKKRYKKIFKKTHKHNHIIKSTHP